METNIDGNMRGMVQDRRPRICPVCKKVYKGIGAVKSHRWGLGKEDHRDFCENPDNYIIKLAHF